MRTITDIRHHPDTLSATVVRNILSEVRCCLNPDSQLFNYFTVRHSRYDVSAFCAGSHCTKLIVRLFHRDSCDVWIIKPGEYSLLPSEAFDL